MEGMQMKAVRVSGLVALTLAFVGCGSSTPASTEDGGPGGSSSSSGASSSSGSSSSGASSSSSSSSGASSSSSGGGDDGGSSSSSSSSSGGGDDGGVDSGTMPEGGSGGVQCATTDPAAFDVTKIGVMEQMTAAPDGTLYWCTRGTSLGLWAPPYTAAPNKTWITFADGAMIFGIAL